MAGQWTTSGSLFIGRLWNLETLASIHLLGVGFFYTMLKELQGLKGESF